MKYLLIIAAIFLCGCSCNPDKKAESEKAEKEAVQPVEETAVEPEDDSKAADTVQDEKVQAEAAEPEKAEPAADEKAEEKKDSETSVQSHSDKVIKSEKNGVRIDVHYPEFGNDDLDNAIRKKAESAARSEQNRLADLRAEESDDLMNIYEYNLSYDVVRSRSDSADVMLMHNEYTGGAHGSTKLEAMMLDANGKQIDPWSVFDNPDEELQKISAEARRQLVERYSNVEGIEEMIQKGTEPKRENYKHMVRTEDGVRVYFEPYTIAPGSEGVLYIDYKMQ